MIKYYMFEKNSVEINAQSGNYFFRFANLSRLNKFTELVDSKLIKNKKENENSPNVIKRIIDEWR